MEAANVFFGNTVTTQDLAFQMDEISFYMQKVTMEILTKRRRTSAEC